MVQNKPDGKLYIVATPIGNARDISLRALDVLGAADMVLCEDTRITGKFLRGHKIDTPLLAYHEHNAQEIRPHILARLGAGATLALVSDAGTPLISDPGYRLVAEARAAGVDVVTVPGASAPIAALSIAGLPTDRFCFLGFVPRKSSARQKWIEALRTVHGTLIMFEAARRLPSLLDALAAVLGARQAVVARELTKTFEETHAGTLPVLAAHYAKNGAPKGEITLLIAPLDEDTDQLDESALRDALRRYMADAPLAVAATRLAHDTGVPRRAIYALGLMIKKGDKK